VFSFTSSTDGTESGVATASVYGQLQTTRSQLLRLLYNTGMRAQEFDAPGRQSPAVTVNTISPGSTKTHVTEKLLRLLWRLPVRPAGSTTLGASYLTGVHLTYTCQDPSPSRPANRIHYGRRHSETRLPGPRPDQYPPRLRTQCCRGVRKIIQISTASSGLFALCDDGTVWGFTANHPGWMRVPDIPQDPPPEERENPVWRWE
jgi:hypothetical protein